MTKISQKGIKKNLKNMIIIRMIVSSMNLREHLTF